MDKKQDDVVRKVRVFLRKMGFVAEKVVLFGSYANGDYREDSDVDLLIVSDNFKGKKLFERGADLYNVWYDDNDAEVDFICLTPEEFDRKKDGINIVKYAVEGGVEING